MKSKTRLLNLPTLSGLAASLAIAAACLLACSSPEPYGALPTDAQLQWQRMEMNMFFHFGPNTFSGREWGDGTEAEDLFNPGEMDCRQWVAVAKDAGFKGVILTAKHHDGFCLWPNPASRHSVAQSSWRDGGGDVLGELSEACREAGIRFGVYISPWDRNDPHYGSDEYNEVFAATLRSALGNYGPVFEQWFDGACGEGPNGKRQVYDWDLFHETVFGLQKDAIVFSNVGPGCRWVGNEEGVASETHWCTFSPEVHGAAQGTLPGDYEKYLGEGDEGGSLWIPAETDVSIRPGWFWKESETARLKSLQRLLQLYYESVGRGSTLLLNVPPDTRGLIDAADSARLTEFRAALDEIFACNLAEGSAVSASSEFGRRFRPGNILSRGSGKRDLSYGRYWAASPGDSAAVLTVDFPEARTFNRLLLQEYLPLGQRVASFEVDVLPGGNGAGARQWQTIARGTTIGHKRILLLPRTTASSVRIRFTRCLAAPAICNLGIYQDDIYRQETEQGSAGAAGRLAEGLETMEYDLGEKREISGFIYTPMRRGEGGVILRYDFEVSQDGGSWEKIVSDGLFENVAANPISQKVSLPGTVEARKIRLVPLLTNAGGNYGCESFGPLE